MGSHFSRKDEDRNSGVTPPHAAARQQPTVAQTPTCRDDELTADAAEAVDRGLAETTASNDNGMTGSVLRRVTTHNVWFGAFEARRRWTHLLVECLSPRPTVLALQEVDAVLLSIIRASRVIAKEYLTSDGDGGIGCGEGHRGYDVLLLVRRDIHMSVLRWWSVDDLPTRMGRRLVGVDLREGKCEAGAVVRVATVHLESTKPNAERRREQLERIQTALVGMAPAAATVLVGDFNLCSSWPHENGAVEENWRDLWPLLHPAAGLGGHRHGYTEDTRINRMRFQMKNSHKQVRFDRVLLWRGTGEGGGGSGGDSGAGRGCWRPETIDLVGTHEIAKVAPTRSGGEELSVFPSDHFGLTATFAVV